MGIRGDEAALGLGAAFWGWKWPPPKKNPETIKVTRPRCCLNPDADKTRAAPAPPAPQPLF